MRGLSISSDGRAVAIDVHAHMIPQGVLAAVSTGTWHGVQLASRLDGGFQIAMGGTRHSFAPWTFEDVDGRLAMMDRTRVDMQVVSFMPSMWFHGVGGHDPVAMARAVNDDLAAFASNKPSRFRAFAHLPLEQPSAAVAELERAMAMGPVVGAAVSTNVDGRNWDDPTLFPVLEAADRVGAVLFFHPAPAAVRLAPHLPGYHLKNLIGNPYETTTAIASLIFGGVLDRLPGLGMVFAHGGGYASLAAGRFDHGHRVRPEARINTLASPSDHLRQMYFDSLLHSPTALEYLIKTVGIDRVVLGTDYPADMADIEQVPAIEQMPSLGETDRRALLGGNLAALLGLDSSSVGSGTNGDAPRLVGARPPGSHTT